MSASPAARGCPGASENVALRLADDGARAAAARSRTAGSASSSSSCASAISSSLVCATSGAAPLETSDRCDARVAEHRALVEHPLHRAAGQPDERLVQHRPVEPEVDGHDRRRRHRARAPSDRRRAPAVAASNSVGEREPRHRGDHRRRGVQRSPPASTRRDAVAVDADRRGGAGSHRRRRALSMNCARRLGVHHVQRPGRQRDRRRARIGAEHLGEHARERAAPPPIGGGWLSAASASGSHSISRSRGVWPLRISQFSTVSPGEAAIVVAPAQLAAREPQRRRHPQHATADRASRARPTRTRRPAGATARGSVGHTSRDRRPARSIIVTRELRLHADVDRRRRCRGGTRTSRCSSRAGRAGRCRRARRSRDRETRSRGRRAALAPRARARARRAASAATAALRPGEAGADDDDVVGGSCGPQPLLQRDQRLPRLAARARAP